MENLTIIIIAFLIGGIIAYFLFGKRKEKDDTGIQLLTQVSELIKNVDNKLGESNKQVNESLRFHSSESNKIISFLVKFNSKIPFI